MPTHPASISGSPRGIANTLAGFVVESENIDEEPVQEDFDDQSGARADEVVYDTRKTLELTVYGASASASAPPTAAIAGSGGRSITYAGEVWKVDSIREAGTYNGRRRWTVRAHRYDNFPPQGGA